MMARILTAWLMLTACMAFPARAQEPAVAAFERAVGGYETKLEAEQVVGGAVALVLPDGGIVQRHHGYADRDAGIRVDDNTLFHWASVTKLFTSIAAMQLVERGLLDLDDPVTDHVPAFARVDNPFGAPRGITIRHLLTHSSGLRGATWPWNADGAGTSPRWQPHEPRDWSQIEAMFPYTGLSFQPGSKASYSNLGISILGRVVEVVSGEGMETYIDKNVLRPLDMHRTYFDTTPWHLAPFRVHGYRAADDGILDLGPDLQTGATNANGGLNGPMADMATFVRWLMTGAVSARVLQPATLDRMIAPQLEFARDDRRTISMGLGFFVVDERGPEGETHRYFGHSGFQAGHRSSLYIAADGSGAFIFAANTVSEGGNSSAGELRIAMVDEVWPQLRQGAIR
jgi:CubicO group peptidase (beta-lactamase class C family)